MLDVARVLGVYDMDLTVGRRDVQEISVRSERCLERNGVAGEGIADEVWLPTLKTSTLPDWWRECKPGSLLRDINWVGTKLP